LRIEAKDIALNEVILDPQAERSSDTRSSEGLRLEERPSALRVEARDFALNEVILKP